MLWFCVFMQFSQSLSRVLLFAIAWITAHQAYLSITNSLSLLKLISTEPVMPSNHLFIFYCPSPPAFNLFHWSIWVFSNESVFCIRWPKYWSFSFNISPSNEYSGLSSFRMDSLDLLAVQGTLKSLLQHHSSKASILWHIAFFIVQLSHPCMTTGKTIALTRHTFVGKVMSLHFNKLSQLVITFLPRSKCLLISWLESPSAVILEPPKIKSVTVLTVSPSICHYVMGPDVMIFPGGSEVKVSACNAGDLDSIPGLGKSLRDGKGNLFQYSCLENPTDGGAWWAKVHGVAKRQIRQSDFTFTFTLMGPDAMILVFWILRFKPTFSLSSFTFLKSSFIFSSLSSLVLPRFLPWGWCHLYMWIYWYFSQQSWFQLVFIPVQHFSWCTLHIS